jgi:hypothetical protein
MARETLKRLWGLAMAGVRDADEIYIVGFGFPTSDTHPREQILDALKANDNIGLKVNIVLGPDVGDSRIRRVQELLRWTLGSSVSEDPRKGRLDDASGRVLATHAMNAEEFLTVWSNDTEIPKRDGP